MILSPTPGGEGGTNQGAVRAVGSELSFWDSSDCEGSSDSLFLGILQSPVLVPGHR